MDWYLTGYDGKKERISLVPINKEKYISFYLYDDEIAIKFRFNESFRFLGTQLEELALKLHQDNFQNLKSTFSNLNDYSLKLLTCKGVFCYDNIDSFQ